MWIWKRGLYAVITQGGIFISCFALLSFVVKNINNNKEKLNKLSSISDRSFWKNKMIKECTMISKEVKRRLIDPRQRLTIKWMFYALISHDSVNAFCFSD